MTWLEIYQDETYYTYRPRFERAARATHGTDAHAGRTPRGPIDPTSPWEAPGVHVGAARGTRGTLEAVAVSVQSLVLVNF